MNVRHDLAAITLNNTASAQLQGQLQRGIEENTALVSSSLSINQRVDERLEKLELLIKATEERLSKNQIGILTGDDMAAVHEHRRRSAEALKKQLPLRPRADAVGVILRRYNTSCGTGCLCICHSQHWARTPELLNPILGQLFVNLSGIPLCGPNATTKSAPGVQLRILTWSTGFLQAYFGHRLSVFTALIKNKLVHNFSSAR